MMLMTMAVMAVVMAVMAVMVVAVAGVVTMTIKQARCSRKLPRTPEPMASRLGEWRVPGC
jgi:hypothetical protein